MTFQEKALKAGRLKRAEQNADRVLSVVMAVFFLFLCFAGYQHFHPTPQGSSKVVNTTSTRGDHPPVDVTINGERWKIVYFDYASDPDFPEGRGGETECERRLIFYDDKRMDTKALLREAVWHEVIHANHCNKGSKDDEANWKKYTHDLPEHNSVYELGMFLPGFVHDNPEFMKWAEDWK